MKNTLIQIIFISVVLSQNTFASIQQNCKHLLLRTSFSLEKKELNNCVKTKKYSTYVKQILNEKQLPLKENHFDTLKVLPKKIGKKFHINEKKAYRKNRKQENKLLQKWWLEKMITTKDPLREKMTLFWHNHFTSSYKKVKQAKLMYNQNQLFRKHALGNFRSLLHDIIKDPAMIIYLDNKYNKKSHPNENLSRELLELFTMGEGNYNEYDVKELARGLSGYSIDKNFEFKFKKRFHDSSGKTFFNTSGYLDADDMIDIILQQKQTSVYIVTKLYKEFVSYTSDKDEILRLAKILKG